MELCSAIRKFAITTTEYTGIVAPIDCDYFLIIGNVDGTAMIRSSDGTDANSYQIPAGGWYSMLAPPTTFLGSAPRYRSGYTVTYIKATTGVGPVAVEFVL